MITKYNNFLTKLNTSLIVNEVLKDYDFDVVYNSPNYKVIYDKTPEAAYTFGDKLNWCTAGGDSVFCKHPTRRGGGIFYENFERNFGYIIINKNKKEKFRVRLNFDADIRFIIDKEHNRIKSMEDLPINENERKIIEEKIKEHCLNEKINKLNKLEEFKNTKILNVSNTNLKQLYLNCYEQLEKIDCSFNKIEKIYYTFKESLQHLNCEHNKIKQLELWGDKNLLYLNCNTNNILYELDLNYQHKLETLICNNNPKLKKVILNLKVENYINIIKDDHTEIIYK